MDTSKLTPAQRLDIHENMKTAIYHLCECWDALREAENTLQEAGVEPGEIETDAIEGVAGNCSPSTDAFSTTAENLDAVLEGIAA